MGVIKLPKQVLRVIFDARRANELMAPRPEKLILFTLDTLILAVARYPYVHTVDYRHFYYQFPLPARLAWWFVVHAGGERFWPRVLPMGWREAVCIAQVTTWMVVLHHAASEKDLERKYGLRREDLEELFQMADMPAYLPLRRNGREVGRIFVLLDGVLVACADGALRDRWAKRLRANEDHFHVVRKEFCNADLRTKGQRAEFAGVQFGPSGWEPRAEMKVGPATGGDVNARQVASRLGSLLWAIRVRYAHDPARKGLLQFPELLQLYHTLGVARAWGRDDVFTLADREAATLGRCEEGEREAAPTAWGAIPSAPPPEEVVLLATDAYPHGLGLVLYDQRGVVLLTRMLPSPRHTKSSPRRWQSRGP